MPCWFYIGGYKSFSRAQRMSVRDARRANNCTGMVSVLCGNYLYRACSFLRRHSFLDNQNRSSVTTKSGDDDELLTGMTNNHDVLVIMPEIRLTPTITINSPTVFLSS